MSGTQKHTELLRKFDERHKNGCVRRCGIKKHNHRLNGYNYAKSNLSSYYNRNFTTPSEKARLASILGPTLFGGNKYRDPRETLNAWHLGRKSNYQVGRWPFSNQAHHLIPVSALHSSLDTLELYALEQGGYNINEGENIIILPSEQRVGEAMEMLTHLGSHPTYNQEVKNEINYIKDQFAEARDPEDDEHSPLEEKDMPNLKEELVQFSKDLMFDIFVYGRNNPGGKLNIVSVLTAR